METTVHPLVTAAELERELRGPRAPRLLDVRWRLDRPDGRDDHRAGHLPGAVYVDLDSELAGHGAPTDGRHPLPATADLQAAARRWGLGRGDAVVVYDDLGGLSAARAWWLLRVSGVADVRLLDGGLAAWRTAGLPVEQGEVTPVPGDVVLEPIGAGRDGLGVVDTEEAGEWPEHGALVDSRAAERFRGDVEPVDPRAGHVPGALSVPTAGNLGPDGTFLEPAALAARYREAGVDLEGDVAVYCGSGVTAAHAALALTLAGARPALWPGSWSAWSSDPARPVAVGDPSDAPDDRRP
ncbi:thiosulfate sulfurtransferase [Frigoribacterium sp. Leaf164]|uniref:sulfurtransferase n=1 Tax=Frigoribacterium sp. Leaf164 TaxID=1736282 RepID=UPI0006F93961|nr:sulfurtransferase [Frigoribacterium sp. Leaf164]KQR43994.1 thiosulfate sulfurtransferase [Frigoribacterium sp. Leaf164]